MLKMSTLIKETGESKSTILYYVKEGLLPPPDKIKPNVHLYKKESTNIIKLIKYFQTNFSYSINQIKSIFDNIRFDFNNDINLLINSLEAISGGNSFESFTIDEVSKRFHITKYEVKRYINSGYISPKNDLFNKNDIKILEIILETKKYNIEQRLFDEYVEYAKKMAKLDYQIGAKILGSNFDNNSNQLHKLMFDIILHFKTYIFNKHTILEFTNRVLKAEDECIEN